jgi:acyl carrier protein
LSVAWGLWEQASAMTQHLADHDKARMSRMGLAPLSTAQALQLFDDAMPADRSMLVAAHIEAAGLGASGAVPPVLRDLVTRQGRRLVADTDSAVSRSGLAARLKGLTPEQRHHQLVELVCTNAAAVLGRSIGDVGADLPFQDLGFDSLTAVELRNRLKSATGLTLSPTAIFDYPTPSALADNVDEQLSSAALTADATTNDPDNLARFNDIARELQTLVNQPDWTDDVKARLSDRIRTILADLTTPQNTPESFDESQLVAILEEDFPV